MYKLNLPTYEFSIKTSDKRTMLFDEIRKKWLVLTPEEWVRQNMIKHLVGDKGYPKGVTSIEGEININKLRRRYDALIYSRQHTPLVLIECKSPTVQINQKVFDQIFTYNIRIIAPYMLVTNGLNHFFLKLDKEQAPQFLKNIPDYDEITPST